jgi:hypothetical protein
VRYLAIATALLLLAGTVGAAETNSGGRPDWCRSGYSCITTDELADDTEFKIRQSMEIIRLKARANRLGFTVGCGVGVAAIVTSEWDAISAPGGFCGAMWGWRF